MNEQQNQQLVVSPVTLKDLHQLDIDNNLLRQFEEWKKLPMLYKLALEELQSKIKLIKTELKLQDGYSPIEHIKVRIKEPKSIMNKMERKGYELTMDNILNHIHDIAGMRIVCAFVQDIYRLLDHLTHPFPLFFPSYHNWSRQSQFAIH